MKKKIFQMPKFSLLGAMTSLFTTRVAQIAHKILRNLQVRVWFRGHLMIGPHTRTGASAILTFAIPGFFILMLTSALLLRLHPSFRRSPVILIPEFVAYRIRRRDFFQGRQLRYVQTSPWYIRFFRPEFVRYERLVNPITVVDGPVGDLHHPSITIPSQRVSVIGWLATTPTVPLKLSRFFRTASSRTGQEPFSLRAAFLERDFNRRRFHQKELFYRFPARPLIKFFLLYVLKRGFLDGRPGFTYALLQSVYEFMIVLKVRELEQQQASN